MRRRSTWVILAAIVLLVGVSIGLGRAASPEGEFAGTDAQATEMLEAAGGRQWFTPVLDLGSAELESGLFAAQAGLGGIVLGYCIGRLHGRRREDSQADPEPRNPGA